MIYTAILQDHDGNSVVKSFNGPLDKNKAFDFLCEFFVPKGYRVIALIPGRHEIVCWDMDEREHLLPREVEFF